MQEGRGPAFWSLVPQCFSDSHSVSRTQGFLWAVMGQLLEHFSGGGRRGKVTDWGLGQGLGGRRQGWGGSGLPWQSSSSVSG